MFANKFFKKSSLLVVVVLASLASGIAYGAISTSRAQQPGDPAAELGLERIEVTTTGKTLAEVTSELSTHAGFNVPLLEGLPEGLRLVNAEVALGPKAATPRHSRATLRFAAEEGDRTVLQIVFGPPNFGAAERTSTQVDLGLPGVEAFTKRLVAGGVAYSVRYPEGGMGLIASGDTVTAASLEAMVRATLS